VHWSLEMLWVYALRAEFKEDRSMLKKKMRTEWRSVLL